MPLVDVASARALILDACPRLPAVTVPLGEALGMVTTTAIHAPEPVPPFANTAMDGYAVRAADTAAAPVELRVVDSLAAGSAPRVAVGGGEAVRIMTGAPLPPGADAVVMVERTSVAGGGRAVRISEAAQPGDHVRGAGEDLRAGEEVFPAGTVLSPGHLGVVASTGRTSVEVVRRARVGVLSTGDELVDDGGPLRPGQIRDSNRPTLLALVRQAGCEPVDLGRCGDTEAQIRHALEGGVAACDAVVTSGGVSVGDFDYVKVVLDELSGGSMQWLQIAVKPAKPLAFGLAGRTPVFGLPGNPVSSMVSFELFARPALLAMMGHTSLDRPRRQAVADEPLVRRPDGKLHLARVRVAPGDDGRYHVRSAGGQGSHMLRAMAMSNALALLPDGTGVQQGGNVEVMFLS
ncbi:MAG TPA: gephyrin-like molybdotransferase Glp [Acidimicrobiales bacterium]|nr:gephyrin-like molybdotransferase Glp [Acidimicrobiales bacterium]